MALIQFSEVRKTFGDVVAVERLELQVKDEEFLVFVGPSGCGKTTSLRMLAGLDEVTSGHIFVDGVDVTSMPPKSRDMAMVFQNYALYPHMTVAENISFALTLRGLKSADIAERVHRAAQMLDIDHLLSRRPRELSGGQRQRVAVCRAIVRNPKVFLFDEPLSNLDPQLRTSARGEIRGLQRQLGVTSVYVTHDQIEAMTMADRVVVMRDGKVQQIGTPVDLFERPANMFVAGFIGSPPMNIVPAATLPTELSARLVSRPLALGEATAIGVRPEHIRLQTAEAGALTARVRLVETIGVECLTHVELPGGSRMIVRAQRETAPRLDQTVGLAWPDHATHLFNSDGARFETPPSLTSSQHHDCLP